VSEVQKPAVERAAEVTPDAILRLGFGFWGSKTLLSAVELGVSSEVAAAGSLDGEALRERLGLHPRRRRTSAPGSWATTRTSARGAVCRRTAAERAERAKLVEERSSTSDAGHAGCVTAQPASADRGSEDR
jgi:hypothetical protein